MFTLKQTTLAIAATAVTASTFTIGNDTAQAAGLVVPNVASIQTAIDANSDTSFGNGEAQIIKVGNKRKRFRKAVRRGIRKAYRHGGVHIHIAPAYHSCVWKKKRYFDHFHGYYYTKRVKVCY